WAIRQHDPVQHLLLGAGITAFLQVMALRFVGWPLMPVGYVAAFTGYLDGAWWSLFLGWIIKICILRFGGAGMFQKAKPIFIGLIFGEALAGAAWLVINMILALGGHEYYIMRVLPS